MTTTTTLRRLQRAGVVVAALAVSGVHGLWLGGGLTILTKNLLDAAENTNTTAALLIHQPSTFAAASVACSLLGESLWTPSADGTSFTTALAPALSYQSYLNLFPASQTYWISKPDPDSHTCRAITASGTISSVACGTNLPALCTQSAPASTSKISDTSSTWQLTHVVGNATLRGYRDLHAFKFRGLRFADPPKRFTYSDVSRAFDAPNGDEEVDATVAGPDCSQPVSDVPHGTSEDCLFANVWTPYLPRTADVRAGKGKENLKPVMIYLYGGGLTKGSGKSTVTDGTNLASRGDVVVVTVNYRVGTLGFLNLNDGVHNGNYAVSDWLSALRWVNRYIEYFGGDPNRVTLFGESAGGMGTHAMMSTAQAKGLFHRVIKISSPDGWPGGGHILRFMKYEELEDNYNSVTKSVLRDAGCANATDAVACLGKLSGFELVNLKTNANGFVKDGTYLTRRELVVNQTEASYVTNVPVMIGINRDEAGIDIDEDKYPSNTTTLAEYFDLVYTKQRGMPADTTKLLGLDKPANVSTYVGLPLPANMTTIASLLTPEQILKTAVRIASAAAFNCYAMAQVYSGAKHKSFGPSYFYTFNRTYGTNGYTRPWCNAPKTAARPNGDPDGEYMKCHASELPLFFGTALRSGYPDRDGLDVPFMQLLIDYWAAYARTGDPNPPVEYLKVRGHEHTLSQVHKTGRWDPVDPAKPMQRWLQWNGGQRVFMEGPVCDMLGAPLDVFERGL